MRITRAIVLVLLGCGNVAAQSVDLQFAPLRRGHLPFDFTLVSAIAAGDVDGDGDVDIVAGRSFTPYQTLLLLNDGHGRYSYSKNGLPIDGDQTQAIALADVDGDKDLDLVLGNTGFRENFRQNRLYLNDGAGRFTDVTATHMPADNDVTSALVLGDVDGDKDVDLIVGNRDATRLNKLYLNDGRGRFFDVTATHLPRLFDDTNQMQLGDVDGDGDLDLVLAQSNTKVIQAEHLWLNDGKGKFTDASSRVPRRTPSSFRIALFDADGDKDLDLVASSFQGNVLYLNDGKGNFSDGTSGRMPADATSAWMMAGDVDADGDTDLFFGPGTAPANAKHLFLNDGKGNFSDATRTWIAWTYHPSSLVTFADVDGDKDLDVVGPDLLYLNDDRSRFLDATFEGIARRWTTVYRALAVDVDGDGGNELLLAMHDKKALYQSDGDGGFRDVTQGRIPQTPGGSTFVAAADVDGDGDVDLLWADRNSTQERLHLNDGKGRFTDVTSTQLPTDADATTSFAFGDVDGDLDPDIVLGNGNSYQGKQNRLWLNDGKGKFTDATSGRIPATTENTGDVDLRDVDNDKDLDLVIGNLPVVRFPNQLIGGQNRLLLNDGKGTFKDVSSTHMPFDQWATNEIELVDVDKDGDLDLVLANSRVALLPGTDRLYLNDGKGKFTDATGSRMPALDAPSSSLQVGDVDEDGDPDLMFGGFNLTTRLYRNDGKGSFADESSAMLPDTGARALALADLDRDGDLDLFLGVTRADRVHYNHHRQIRAPQYPRLGRKYEIEYYAKPGHAKGPQWISPYIATSKLEPRVRIHPFGWLGVSPIGLLILPAIPVPQPKGFARLDLVIPNVSALRGVQFFLQNLTLHGTGIEDWRYANRLREAILR